MVENCEDQNCEDGSKEVQSNSNIIISKILIYILNC